MIHSKILTPVSIENDLRPAALLDRDGTVTVHNGYVTGPEQVELLGHAASAIRQLSEAGYACVLITNQSAIGRGMISATELDAIHDVLIKKLALAGASLAAIYYCPDAPIGSDETVTENQDRKPGPGMLLQAAKELKLDLSRSWMIGDRLSDVLAGKNAGCLGSIRVRTGYTYQLSTESCDHVVVNSLRDAARVITASS